MALAPTLCSRPIDSPQLRIALHPPSFSIRQITVSSVPYPRPCRTAARIPRRRLLPRPGQRPSGRPTPSCLWAPHASAPLPGCPSAPTSPPRPSLHDADHPNSPPRRRTGGWTPLATAVSAAPPPSLPYDVVELVTTPRRLSLPLAPSTSSRPPSTPGTTGFYKCALRSKWRGKHQWMN